MPVFLLHMWIMEPGRLLLLLKAWSLQIQETLLQIHRSLHPFNMQQIYSYRAHGPRKSAGPGREDRGSKELGGPLPGPCPDGPSVSLLPPKSKPCGVVRDLVLQAGCRLMLEGRSQAYVFQKEIFPILNHSVSLSRERAQAQSLGLKEWQSLLINRQRAFSRNTSPLWTTPQESSARTPRRQRPQTSPVW